jgi:hypothetical protein
LRFAGQVARDQIGEQVIVEQVNEEWVPDNDIPGSSLRYERQADKEEGRTRREAREIGTVESRKVRRVRKVGPASFWNFAEVFATLRGSSPARKTAGKPRYEKRTSRG